MVGYHAYEFLSGVTPFELREIDGETVVLKIHEDYIDKGIAFIEHDRGDENISSQSCTPRLLRSLRVRRTRLTNADGRHLRSQPALFASHKSESLSQKVVLCLSPSVISSWENQDARSF